jgi:hypothetical protein
VRQAPAASGSGRGTRALVPGSTKFVAAHGEARRKLCLGSPCEKKSYTEVTFEVSESMFEGTFIMLSVGTFIMLLVRLMAYHDIGYFYLASYDGMSRVGLI